MATSTATNTGPTPLKPASDTEALSEQISTLRADVSALAELMGDIGKARGQEAKHRIEEKAHEARDRGEEALREAGARFSELEGETRSNIAANPFRAIGIAAAVGFVLGYVGSRR